VDAFYPVLICRSEVRAVVISTGQWLLQVLSFEKGTERGVLGMLPVDCRRTLSIYSFRILTDLTPETWPIFSHVKDRGVFRLNLAL
jgi:hypothetical protein